MDKKKILIVSRSFYPENSPRSFRTTELAKEFARQGHEVTVLIPDLTETRLQFAHKHGFDIKSLGRLKWKVPQFGNSKLGYFMTRAAVRIFQLGFEYPDIELMFKVNMALKKESAYDLLISIAVPYPIHWGVAWARTKKHPMAIIWVADCGDPYVGCDTDSFKKLFYFKYVEKWFMRKADFVSIPVESARKAYYPEFDEKIKVIPQGFKIEPIILEAPQKNHIPTFAYAGGFLPGKRDPRPFLDYLAALQKDFIFFMYAKNPGILSEHKKSLGEKLQIRDFVPREDLLKILAGMDFLVNLDNNTTTAVPSKLIDYFIVDRPVLNIGTKLNTLAIQQFLNGNYSQALKIRNIDQYRIERVCNQFLALTNNVK